MNFGDDFLARTPKARTTKEKIDELDFLKPSEILKYVDIFRVSSNPQNERKKPPTNSEKIFANDIPDKGSISRINNF